MSGPLFDNDTALVTGSGNGIGRAIAKALEDEGVRVLGADLKGSDLAIDLSKPGEAKRLAAEAIEKLGKVSIFVHSASPRRREEDTALEVSEATWREMQEVNLNAGFLLGQVLGRHMRDHKIRGRMLYVTSLHAYSPRNLPHYSAAKAGQTMLVREFARALGPDGIRVNAIAPGAIPGGGFDASKNPGLLSTIAMGRFGTPADVAAMASFRRERIIPCCAG